MKKLPLSRQHFEPFSKENLIYVDKTELIYALTSESRGYFLSRPRRFGKSLLVDTIQQLFFDAKEFENYWFRTGTPSFLIKFLKRYKISADELEGRKVFPLFFDSFELKEKLDVYPLMFQTGYSTVKAVKRKGIKKHYILGFPNYEVRQSFIGHLIWNKKI